MKKKSTPKEFRMKALNLPFSTGNARSAVSPESPVLVWSSVAAPAAENRLTHLWTWTSSWFGLVLCFYLLFYVLYIFILQKLLNEKREKNNDCVLNFFLLFGQKQTNGWWGRSCAAEILTQYGFSLATRFQLLSIEKHFCDSGFVLVRNCLPVRRFAFRVFFFLFLLCLRLLLGKADSFFFFGFRRV